MKRERTFWINKLLIFCIALSYIFLSLLVDIAYSQKTHPQQPETILVLHSYSNDFQWTNGLNQGIIDGFKELNRPTLFRVEFMDTKNIYNKTYINSLFTIYKQKYAKAQPDGIIVSDNNALSFIEEHGEELFPGVPVVACGINKAVPPATNSQIKSIIVEQADHGETIRQAHLIRPDAQRVFVIYDSTPTGISIAEEIRTINETNETAIPVEYITEMSFDELKHFASTRRKNDFLYLLPFFRSADGRILPQGDAEKELSGISSVPILVSWAYQLNTGTLGGNTLQPNEFGKQAALTLAQILQGNMVPPFQKIATTQQNIYDHKTLQRFNIPESNLPENAIIINKPVNFLEKHSSVLIPASGAFTVLLCIVALLAMNLKKQKLLNQNNLKMMELDNEIIETQRELVTTLGEVIEVRSKETGNHVKRVASISRLLGEKLGLETAELKLLEAASPMHDVGKIGIPETILHKKGRLTDKEYEIIKQHTNIGNDILNKSKRELLNTARIIASQHHERWDGTGYPYGLRGKNIHIYARITTLADIYDAISSDRCYKTAWPEEKVFKYIKAEKGKIFDPSLVDLFFEYIDEIRIIRSKYPSQ
ncbi:HD domain-containing phosphohydrolase [Maridesulfovibrio salexigens]|uniref:Metal dependent phosphohydrolase n=1 Tax=Maridesulfovibrio salexigens (strain ATCC 14822 / DSM 2638 / NCIMB 8403 / VKM B-1763) TaxID=526222 RepID=C6BXY1_MARSD|nr:HD domain-containing phosphohydrolase [Maridesulfovibrio salexigens]ACS80511.1 metal dependent phosphohydrolase [Maridesulfovibrio salexigens DSM 2638]